MAEAKTKKVAVAKKSAAPKKVAKTTKTKQVEKVKVAAPSSEEAHVASKAQKTSKSDLAGKSKAELIQLFATKDGDTGSPEVQIALATHKVFNLTAHLEQNPKDNHSRRGLLKVISKRRRILNYLAEKDEKRYKELIKKLALKK